MAKKKRGKARRVLTWLHLAKSKEEAKEPPGKTALLPPLTAVRISWAMTGLFPKETSSQEMAALSESDLKHIEEQAAATGVDARERAYVTSAVATMRASMRSLDTVYKGRALSFEENEKLRLTYLEDVKETVEFGKRAQDVLKSVPTMAIFGALGVALASLTEWSDIILAALGIGSAGLGYLVNLWVVRGARGRKRKLYVSEDYERTLYYDQYVARVSMILTGLLGDLEYIHRREFGGFYGADGDAAAAKKEVTRVLAGVSPTHCPHLHEHMAEGMITPELWAKCESGVEDTIKQCKYWPAAGAVR